MKIIIYKATNINTEKAYIGFTNDMQQRQKKHFSDAYAGSTTHFHNAIRKYGIKVFDWEILAECDTREEAGDTEIKLIAEHDTYHSGYNSTTGGERNWNHTKETKQKLSKARKEKTYEEIYGIERAAELKRKCRIRMQGNTINQDAIPWNKGKKGCYSEDVIKKMSHLQTKETRAKISKSKIGKPTKLRGIKQLVIGCPHCKKSGGISNMKRWHFTNCKNLV